MRLKYKYGFRKLKYHSKNQIDELICLKLPSFPRLGPYSNLNFHSRCFFHCQFDCYKDLEHIRSFRHSCYWTILRPASCCTEFQFPTLQGKETLEWAYKHNHKWIFIKASEYKIFIARLEIYLTFLRYHIFVQIATTQKFHILW